MRNLGGSVDDWHKQKRYFGIAFADIFLACPTCIISIILIFYLLVGVFTCWHSDPSGSPGEYGGHCDQSAL
ncbi:MAG: hypothetical protein JEZ06_09115 [Anaerolineaceae bacterium]|nr:hypothetical protein [Anaerolineaceae bacterium]